MTVMSLYRAVGRLEDTEDYSMAVFRAENGTDVDVVYASTIETHRRVKEDPKSFLGVYGKSNLPTIGYLRQILKKSTKQRGGT